MGLMCSQEQGIPNVDAKLPTGYKASSFALKSLKARPSR